MVGEASQRISRPRQIYTGELRRKFVPVYERQLSGRISGEFFLPPALACPTLASRALQPTLPSPATSVPACRLAARALLLNHLSPSPPLQYPLTTTRRGRAASAAICSHAWLTPRLEPPCAELHPAGWPLAEVAVPVAAKPAPMAPARTILKCT